jgi:hypothetical protein
VSDLKNRLADKLEAPYHLPMPRTKTDYRLALLAAHLYPCFLDRDDPVAEAVAAARAIASACPSAPSDPAPRDAAHRRSREVARLLAERGGSMTRDQLRGALGVGHDLLERALDVAITDKLVERRFRGRKQTGYAATGAANSPGERGPAPSAPTGVAPPPSTCSCGAALGSFARLVGRCSACA